MAKKAAITNARSQGSVRASNKGKGKAKDEVPVIPQKDLFQRINFSFQASVFLQSLGESSNAHSAINDEGSSSTTGGMRDLGSKIDKKGKRRAVEATDDGLRVPGDGDGDGEEERRRFRRMARLGMRETKKMGVHTQLKLDPSLKRSVCKSCSTVLIPGLTSRIRNRPNRNSFSITHHTCLTCLASLSIPAPPLPPLSTTPTPASSEGQTPKPLDGPVRSRRRQKASKRGKRAFHELEKSEEGGSGHVLWKGDEKVVGWGLTERGVHGEEGDGTEGME